MRSARCPIRISGSSNGASQTGKSEYKGVDVGLDKRFAQGYSFGISYTLGDSQDNTAEHLAAQGSQSFPQDSRDLSNWYGPSDYDVRHRFGTNFVVELPFGDHWLARDWIVSGIFAWRSGRPYMIRQANNNVGINMTGLPNEVSDPEGPETVEQWFNTAAFQPVSNGIFGNVPRNRLRGS